MGMESSNAEVLHHTKPDSTSCTLHESCVAVPQVPAYCAKWKLSLASSSSRGVRLRA